MYNLYYFRWDPILMCTFSNYTECKKALDVLKEKYPKYQIWMSPVVAINSFEEWRDKFKNGDNIYK